jgi:hypothetical protein
MLNHRYFYSLLLFLILQPALSPGADLYRWVDQEGTVHMTDALAQVPAQYRDQVDTRTLGTATQRDGKPSRISATLPSGLNHFEIPYQAFEGTARRIIIPVTFNDSVTARMLLDTGSPGLMISPELAERLGLVEERKGRLRVMAAGIGGSVAASLAIVDTVRVGDAHSEFLPATITKIPSSSFEGLVGMDFMANYRIEIDTKNNVLVLNELPPQLDRPGGHDESWWRSNFQNFAGLRAQWGNSLADLDRESLASSERERRADVIKEQFEEADRLCRKLERYARDNSVPVSWRH